jgi:hypothetical protein
MSFVKLLSLNSVKCIRFSGRGTDMDWNFQPKFFVYKSFCLRKNVLFLNFMENLVLPILSPATIISELSCGSFQIYFDWSCRVGTEKRRTYISHNWENIFDAWFNLGQGFDLTLVWLVNRLDLARLDFAKVCFAWLWLDLSWLGCFFSDLARCWLGSVGFCYSSQNPDLGQCVLEYYSRTLCLGAYIKKHV